VWFSVIFCTILGSEKADQKAKEDITEFNLNLELWPFISDSQNNNKYNLIIEWPKSMAWFKNKSF